MPRSGVPLVRRAGLQTRLNAQNLAPGRQGRLFPPEDLGLLEGPDREAWQKPEQIMDALGVADGSTVADIGAGAGLVHDSTGSPGRPKRHGLRAGRAAADARGHPPARRARGPAERETRLGAGSAPNLPAAFARRRARRRHVSERWTRPRDVPAQSGRRAETRRPPRHRELQARDAADRGRRRDEGVRVDSASVERRRAGGRTARARPPDAPLSIPARSGPAVESSANLPVSPCAAR